MVNQSLKYLFIDSHTCPACPERSRRERTKWGALVGANLFYNPNTVKNFDLMLVFGRQVVFNSRFNVKNEPVRQNITKLPEILAPKGGVRGLQQS